jgi:adenosylcobinamide-phosphate synthase
MLFHADALAVLLIALAADAVIGDPDAVWRRWPHPVTWIGSLIDLLDRSMNREALCQGKEQRGTCQNKIGRTH